MEDEDYDSDSTVLLTEYFDKPEKIDAKRRRLSNFYDKIHADKLDDEGEENTPPADASDESRTNDKYTQRNNVDKNLLIAKYFAGLSEVNIENNEQLTFPVTKQIKKELNSYEGRNSMKNAANSGFDDDIICLDSDDETQIDDGNARNQNENLNNASVHKVYGDNNNLTEDKSKYGKLKVLKPAAINARRATINVFEHSVLVDNSDDSFRFDNNKTDTTEVTRPSVIIARRATISFEENCNTINVKTNEANETNAINNASMTNKNITVQSATFTSTAISVDTKKLNTNRNKRICNEDNTPSGSKRLRIETMSKCTQHVQLKNVTHNNEIVSCKLTDNLDKKKLDENTDNNENENLNNTHSEQEKTEAYKVSKTCLMGFKSTTSGMRRIAQGEERASEACDLPGTNKVPDQQEVSVVPCVQDIRRARNEEVINKSHNKQGNPGLGDKQEISAKSGEQDTGKVGKEQVINKSLQEQKNTKAQGEQETNVGPYEQEIITVQDEQEISAKSDEQDTGKVGNEQVINESLQKQKRTKVQGEQETNIGPDEQDISRVHYEQEISRTRNAEVINKSHNKQNNPELHDKQEIRGKSADQDTSKAGNEQVINESLQKQKRIKVQGEQETNVGPDEQDISRVHYEQEISRTRNAEVINKPHNKENNPELQDKQEISAKSDKQDTGKAGNEQVINGSHQIQKKTKVQGRQKTNVVPEEQKISTVQDKQEISRTRNEEVINKSHNKENNPELHDKQEIRGKSDDQNTSKAGNDQVINESLQKQKKTKVQGEQETNLGPDEQDISRVRYEQEISKTRNAEVINKPHNKENNPELQDKQEISAKSDEQDTGKAGNEQVINDSHQIQKKTKVQGRQKTNVVPEEQKISTVQDKQEISRTRNEEVINKSHNKEKNPELQDKQKRHVVPREREIGIVHNELVMNQSNEKRKKTEIKDVQKMYKACYEEVINVSHDKHKKTKVQSDQEMHMIQDEQDIGRVRNEEVVNELHDKQGKFEVQDKQEKKIMSGEQEICRARQEEVINKSHNREKNPELQDKQEITLVPDEQSIGKERNEHLINESHQKQNKTEIQGESEMYKVRYEAHDKHKKTKVQSDQGMRTVQVELETCSVPKEEVINKSHDKQKKTKLQGNQEINAVHNDREICKANNHQEINESYDKQEKYKVQSKQVISDAELKADKQVQHTQRTTKVYNKQDRNKVNDEQKTNEAIRESEKNERDEITRKPCPNGDQIRIHNFQVKFFTVVKNFIEKVYPESAMVLQNLIQTLKTHAMNGIVKTDLNLTCPECKHVSTYSSSFLNNTDPEKNIATADDFQKCRLCQTLTKLHVSYMKKFLKEVTEGAAQNKVKNNVATKLSNDRSSIGAVNRNRPASPTTINTEIIAKVPEEADTAMSLCKETSSQNMNVLKPKVISVQPKPSHVNVETLPKNDPVITKKRVSSEYMIDSKRKKLNAEHNGAQHVTDYEDEPEEQTKTTNIKNILDPGIKSKSNLIALAVPEEFSVKENEIATDHVSSDKVSSTLVNENIEINKPGDNILDSGPSARSENEIYSDPNMETTNCKENDKANEITLQSLEDTFTKLKHNTNTEQTKNKKAREQQFIMKNDTSITSDSSRYKYHCTVCDEILNNDYASRQHRKQKHPEFRNQQIYKKVIIKGKDEQDEIYNENEELSAEDSTDSELEGGTDAVTSTNNNDRHCSTNQKKVHQTEGNEARFRNDANNKQQTRADVSGTTSAKIIGKNKNSNMNQRSTDDITTRDFLKYMFHCSICNEILSNYYASRQHRQQKHPEFRNRQIYKKVIIKDKDEDKIYEDDNEQLDEEENVQDTSGDSESESEVGTSVKEVNRQDSTNYKQTREKGERSRNDANYCEMTEAITEASKYKYHCTVCDEILHNYYASRQHRKQKHPELRRRQIYKKVTLKDKEEQDGGECSLSDDSDLDDNEESASDANEEENGESDDNELEDTSNGNNMLNNTKRFKYACALCKEKLPSYYIARKHRVEKHPNMNRAHLIIKIRDNAATIHEQSLNKKEKNQSPGHESSSSIDNGDIEDNNDKIVSPSYEKEGYSNDEAIQAFDHTIKNKRDHILKLFSGEKEASRPEINEKISTQEARMERSADQLRTEHKKIENINTNSINNCSEMEDALASEDESLKVSEHTAKKKKKRITKLFGDENDVSKQPNNTDSDQKVTTNNTSNTSDLKPNDDVSKTKYVHFSEENVESENNDDKCETNTSYRQNAKETWLNKSDENCNKGTDASELPINGKNKMDKLNNAETKVQDDDRTEIDMIDCFLDELSSGPSEIVQNRNLGNKNNEDPTVTASQINNGEIQNNEEYQCHAPNLSVKVYEETCLGNIKITNVTSIADNLYIYVCQECHYATDDYDVVIRHCQNHYNNIEEPVNYCQICQIKYDVPCFERHESSHDKYLESVKIYFSYEWLFANWQRVFENNDMLLTVAEEMQVKSIYKTFCVKMVVEQDGPWQTSLYLCRKCNNCVPPQDIESHVQKRCQFVNENCCSVCNYAFITDDMRMHHEIYHKDDASKLFKIIVFNDTDDDVFNLKLFQAKAIVKNEANQRVTDIYKCLCGLCFISLKKFKYHFAECEELTNNGLDCPECPVLRRFLPAELTSHRSLHHSAANYEFKVQRIGFQEETNDNNNSKAVCNTPAAEKENGSPPEMEDIEVNDMLKDETLTQISNADETHRHPEPVEHMGENLTDKRDMSSNGLLTQNLNENNGQGFPENVKLDEEDLAVKREMLKDETLTQISNEDESQRNPVSVECIEENLTDKRNMSKKESLTQNSNDNDGLAYPENIEINEDDLAAKKEMLKDKTLTQISNEDESQRNPVSVECIEDNLTDKRNMSKNESSTQNSNDNDGLAYPENIEINEDDLAAKREMWKDKTLTQISNEDESQRHPEAVECIEENLTYKRGMSKDESLRQSHPENVESNDDDLAVKREMLKDETLTQTTNKDSEQSGSESVRRNGETLAFETDVLNDEKLTQTTDKAVEQRDSEFVQLYDENLAVEIHTLSESLRNTDDGHNQSNTDSVEFDEDLVVKKDKTKDESLKQDNEVKTEFVELSDDDDVNEKIDSQDIMDVDDSELPIPIDSDSDSDIEFVCSNL